MIIQVDIHSKIKIDKLEYLHKLKLIMEENNLKVNKSQIGNKKFRILKNKTNDQSFRRSH